MAEFQIHNDSSSTSSSELDMEGAEGSFSTTQTTTEMSNTETPGACATNVGTPENLGQLFEKQKSDIMYELRRLQHGEKPVTGQDSRKNLEDFFSRNTESGSSAANTEEHRPEAVIVEVQGLVQQRRVSSVLQSQRFRRQLENVIRGNIGTARQSVPPRPPRPQVASAIPPNMLSESQVNLSASRSQSASSTSLNSVQTSVSGNSIPSNTANIPAPPALPNQSVIDGVPEPPLQPVNNAQAWVMQQPQYSSREQQQHAAWDNIEGASRENMIMEISELIQQQLVTSTLEGQFRGTLESRMQERLHNTGTDGARVQNYIQSIQQTQPHRRNDFSDLGIPVAQPGGADNWENVSVISATAAVHVPYAQSQVAMSREMQSLRSQLTELKSMMKLSFDLQMDIQRSIRQEVSAALTQAMGGSAAAHEPVPASRPVQDSHCLICLDNYADSVLYRCGHMCVCNSCGLSLQSRGAHCPVCRAPIKDIIRAYRSNHE